MSHPQEPRLTPEGLDRFARERAGLHLEPEARASLLGRLRQLELEARSFAPLVEPEDEPLASLE